MSLYGLRPLIDSIMGTGSTAYVPWGHITGTLSAQTDLAAALAGKVPITRTITINGTALDLAADRSWSVGTITGTVANNRLVYGTGTSSLGAVTAIPAGYVMYADSNGLPTFDNTSGKNFFYDGGNHTLILGSTTNVTASSLYGAIYVPIATPANGSLGLIMVGTGTFGSGGTFAGISGGTALAINLSAATKDFINCQTNGTKKFNVNGDGSILLGDVSSSSGVYAKYQAAGGFVFHGTNNGQDVISGNFGSGSTMGLYLSTGGMSSFGEAGFPLSNAMPHVFGSTFGQATGAVGKFLSLNGTLTAGANGDSLYELYLDTTLAAGGKTGLTLYGIYQNKTDRINYLGSQLQIAADLKLTTAGNGIYIKTGTNATAGTGTLTAGTVVISTTKITANSMIFLSDAGGGVLANIGSLYVSARNAGAGTFTVSSSNVLDSSNFYWLLIEPA